MVIASGYHARRDNARKESAGDAIGRGPRAERDRLSNSFVSTALPLISGAGLNRRNVAVLLAMGAIGMAVSYVVFARRDL